MSKSVKGTQTEKNLLKAFAGESQARNRYTFFASIARNEKEHAEIFFKYLEGGDVRIEAAYPAGIVGDTKANLKAAADGEKMEWSEIYAKFEQTARKEGFKEVAKSFKEIAEVEEFHEKRYRKLGRNVGTGEVFKKKTVVRWHCTNCGYIHEGTEAPKECPACRHPQAYYELL